MSVRKVCIDPGHGMSNRSSNVFDPGAGHVEGTHAFREADIVLKYGLELKDVLRSRGIPVFMTRDDNTDQAPVGKRAGNAEKAGCDTFISLHLNDIDDDSANGLEVLYRDDKDMEFADKMRDALVKITGIKKRDNKKRTDLAVLKFNGKAILIELGFIANDKDRNVLLNPQIRQAVCEKIADVILA